MLDNIVERELRMNMSDRSARSQTETLFVSYLSLLRRNGLKHVIGNTPKLAMYHVVSAVKAPYLRKRLESDLDLKANHIRKDFKGFMEHAVKLSEAFEMLHNGTDQDRSGKKKIRKRKHFSKGFSKKSDAGKPDNTENNFKSGSSSRRNNRPPPPCPHLECKYKQLRHCIDDCTCMNDNEKAEMKADIAAAKARDGPSRSTRGQKQKDSGSSLSNRGRTTGTIGRVTDRTTFTVTDPDQPSFVIYCSALGHLLLRLFMRLFLRYT